MTFGGKFATALLFLGDIAACVLALFATLLIRSGTLPGWDVFLYHLVPFSAVFALWVLVFFMAGLYSKRFLFAERVLFGVILHTQLINMVLAALFFFLVPGVPITPRASLVLFFGISLALLLLWRLVIFVPLTHPKKTVSAALIGEGSEVMELMRVANENARLHIKFMLHIPPEEFARDFGASTKKLEDAGIRLLVVDLEHNALHPLLPKLYELAFVSPGYRLVDFYDAYEEVFDRVPLSLLEYQWFLKNVTRAGSRLERAVKRIIDIVGALFMGVITVLITPCVALALSLESRGPVFIAQKRLGRFGTRITCYKFRSMRHHKPSSTEWTTEEARDNPVTSVGNFLRRTSLDEFPQFVNILRGELSLIGPRNDIEGLGARLGEAIPYYNLRYIVKPGITGWAQINQRYEPGAISPQSIEDTRLRLAYDFYYIKHRSLALDLVIALKTVKRMLFRVSNW